MENRELTKTRVRNLMDDIPKNLKHNRLAKVRNTMKRTFSGMNTLLGQLAHSKTDKIRAAKKHKRNVTIVTACIVAAIVVIILIVVLG